MNIRSISFDRKTSKVSIDFDRRLANDRTQNIGLTDDTPIDPEFEESFNALRLTVCEFNGWPVEWAPQITVTSLSYKDYGDHFGAIIHSSRKLPVSGLVHNQNTPLCKSARGERAAHHMTDETVDRINRVLADASNYISRQRKQQELFSGDGADQELETDAEPAADAELVEA